VTLEENARLVLNPSARTVIVPRIVFPFAVFGIAHVHVARAPATVDALALSALPPSVARQATVGDVVGATPSLRANVTITEYGLLARGLSGRGAKLFTTSVGGVIKTSYEYTPTPGAKSRWMLVRSSSPVGVRARPEIARMLKVNRFVPPSSDALSLIVAPFA
jgi:hypothetical protein